MKVITKEKQKSLWISKTGYRVFIEIKALLESPKTAEQLLDLIKNSPIFEKELSKDTIRCDINTLRNAGCNISKPSKSNNFKYQMNYHPFKLYISDEEMKIINELRENLSVDIELNEVFALNDLYEKIAALTLNNEQIQIIHDARPLADINKNIVNEISALLGKKLQIRYKSPQYGEENIDIIPLKILYENKKVYISAYNFKYNHNSFFELSKVLKINSVTLTDKYMPVESYTVIYEVTGDAFNVYEPKSYEKIIEKRDGTLKVEADVTNEFMFIQRLLLFGRDFKIIKPDFFRQKLIDKIKLLQKRYKND